MRGPGQKGGSRVFLKERQPCQENKARSKPQGMLGVLEKLDRSDGDKGRGPQAAVMRT